METEHILIIRPIEAILKSYPQYAQWEEFSISAHERVEKYFISFYNEVADEQNYERLDSDEGRQYIADTDYYINPAYISLLQLNQKLVLSDPPNDLFIVKDKNQYIEYGDGGVWDRWFKIRNMITSLKLSNGSIWYFWSGDDIHLYIYEIENTLCSDKIIKKYSAFIIQS